MKKFKDAFNGIKIAFKHKAVMIQLALGVCAIIGGIIIHLDYYEWLAFIICIGLVITSEVFNTTIERIGNYLNIYEDKKIKQIKDLSSASVLISSIMALAVCVATLIRRIVC